MKKSSWRRVVWISLEATIFILFVGSLIYQGRAGEGLAIGLLLLVGMIMWHRKRIIWHGRRTPPSDE